MSFYSTTLKSTVLVALMTFLTSCAHTYEKNHSLSSECECPTDKLETPVIAGNVLELPVTVSVTPDGAGGFKFRYTGQYFDPDGNFNFTRGDARRRHVLIKFQLSKNVPENLKFISPGRDAMFIVEKSRLDSEDDSPTKPFEPNPNRQTKQPQFEKFKTSADGRSLTVFDQNNNGETYRYNLRFELDGKLVVHDPDGQNDDWD